MGVAAPPEVALDRNLRLIPIHMALSHAFVWIPIMVLFTRARFDLDGALLLSSIYYLSVVALEVPSGWMSDRLGRVFTVRVAAVAWIGAHASFLIGDDRFWAIVLGQILLAVGFASLSGTDVTLHYDTVESAGLEAEFPRREARVRSIALISSAVSALAGGALGLIDLRLVFAAALVLAVGQLAVTLQFSEPPAEHHAERFTSQLVTCARYLSDRLVGWVFFYGVLMVTLEHVAFALMQPWLTEVLGRPADDVGAAPLFAGAVYAVTAIVGAGWARASAPLAERFGTIAVLIGLAALSATIVTGMALWTNAAVLFLVVFRTAQGAAAPVLISSVIAPRTQRRHRATLLSLDSLAGRLGWGAILLFVSTDAGDDVSATLRVFAWIAWSMVAILLATTRIPRNNRVTPTT